MILLQVEREALCFFNVKTNKKENFMLKISVKVLSVLLLISGAVYASLSHAIPKDQAALALSQAAIEKEIEGMKKMLAKDNETLSPQEEAEARKYLAEMHLNFISVLNATPFPVEIKHSCKHYYGARVNLNSYEIPAGATVFLDQCAFDYDESDEKRALYKPRMISGQLVQKNNKGKLDKNFWVMCTNGSITDDTRSPVIEFCQVPYNTYKITIFLPGNEKFVDSDDGLVKNAAMGFSVSK